MKSQAVKEFIGWVPCVGGELSFKFFDAIGLGDSVVGRPLNFIYSNEGKILHCGFNYVSKDWRDELCPNESDKECGIFHVCLFFNNKYYQETRDGFVLLIKEKSANEYCLDGDQPTIRTKFIRLCNDVFEKINEDEIVDCVARLREHVLYVACMPGVFAFQFKLARDGLVELVGTGNQQSDDCSIEKTLAKHAYYAIKYAFHKHQHHHNNNDCLLSIYECSDPNFPILMIRDLKEAVVEAKRRKVPGQESPYVKALFDAKGILTYAKTLILVMRNRGCLTDEQADYQEAGASNLCASLDVLLGDVKRKIDEKDHIENKSRSILLFWLAIVGPLLILYRDFVIIYFGTEQKSFILLLYVLTLLSVYLIYKFFLKQNITGHFLAHKLYRFINFVVQERRSAVVVTIFIFLAAVCCLAYATYSAVRALHLL